MSSISPAPTFNLPTRDDLLRSAFSMPFSPMREAWEQAQQSAMTMPLIGTMIRGAITPPSNTPPKIVSGMGPAADIFSAVMNAPAVARDLAQNVIGRLPSMTPDEWKASPYYRKEIPYDPGMTEERAAALAWQFDLGQARAFMSEKQAWTGPFGIRMPSLATFAGQFAGGLIDPTNYIPIFGPAARAAAVARFGAKGLLRFGTELTIDAAEAAANVAIFSGLSARERAQYGDDISWQAQINNIAMSAFIGAVMHPIIRGIGLGVAGGKAAATMAADRIAARNFKVADVETARAVMNDVVASIVEKGKPEMSRPAQTVVDKLVQKVAVETQRDNALKAETAAVKGDKAGEVVISPVGTRVNVRAEVVELSSLVQATGDLQGRDTSRLASDARAQEIAANYDPARAMPSIEGDRGAPIVGEDNVIDGGNHRVKALQIVYAAHPDKAEAYKAHLQANGYNIDGFNQPVLIQRRTTPLTPEARSKFAAELNTSATARMSSSEQAAADRAALDDATLKQLAPGPVTSVENRAFVSRFLGNLPSAERTALIDKGGELNADGQRRIENALVAEAYGDVDATVLRRFSEATDDNTRSVVGAMADVAGNWSLLRRAMKRGDVAPEFDTTVELTTALRFLAGAREDAAAQKRPVSIVVKEGMAQLDMLGGGMSDEARAFVRMFYKTDEFKQSAGRDVIAARLQRVINAAEELGQPQLFGDAAAASKLGVISHALNDEQGFLFTDDGARSSDGTVGEGGGAAAAGADSGGSAQETGASGAASRSIADRMSERIVAAGRGGDEAKAIGNLVEAFYVKQAERLGLPVAEFERMFPLPEVRGPGPIGEGALAQERPIDAGQMTQVRDLLDAAPPDPQENLFVVHNLSARGAISLLPEGTAPVLHILQNADASTAMHEMGHYFLHILKQIADKDNAPFAIKRDFETLKEWWASNADEVAADAPLDGVTADDVKTVLRNGTTGDRVKDLAIDVALQEHWARGFEAYLREGQAPTPGLRGVFEQFKAWLVDVYKRIIDLRVKLSPEVKGVMDRMLGAEDAAATPASTTDANVQKAGNPTENVAQDPGQSALDFAAPPDPAPLPGIAEAEARLSTGPDDMAQLREQFGVDESGGFAEQGDIDLLEAQGLLSPDDKAALDAADVDIKNAESWGDALMTAARCAFRF